METRNPADTVADVVRLAAAHGMTLDSSSVRRNEAGLDFRVALACTQDGAHWVLRIPRRADLAADIAAEARTLRLVKGRLEAAVPDWRVQTDALIAYPLLPGRPGLTVDGDNVSWHYDVTSLRFAASFGRLLARLHAIPVEEARAAGLPVRSMADERAKWRADVESVRGAFTIAPGLLERWRAWLDDDSLWSGDVVLTHGELYPAHLLINEEDEILSVLDWTTARVGDPARDFAFQHAMGGPEAFQRTVDTYVAAGGREWPRLAQRCAGLMAASPVGYGIYALRTGRPEHRAAADAQLNPPS